MTTTCSYDFTYYDSLIIAGIVVAEEIEIEGSVAFQFTPGRKSRNWADPDEDPEIDITDIALFGHDRARSAEARYRGEYRNIPVAEPIWHRIADWLMKDRFSEMCAAADGYSNDADYRYDQRRDALMEGDAA